MSNKYKIRSGFKVVGPNTNNFQITSWHFPTLAEARGFAEHIAEEVDAEYDILQYIGTVRQVPLPARPIEWVEATTEPDKKTDKK